MKKEPQSLAEFAALVGGKSVMPWQKEILEKMMEGMRRDGRVFVRLAFPRRITSHLVPHVIMQGPDGSYCLPLDVSAPTAGRVADLCIIDELISADKVFLE